MNLSNSFVNSFKWWPLQNNNNNHNNNKNNNSNVSGNSHNYGSRQTVSIDIGDCGRRNNVKGSGIHQTNNCGNNCHNNFKGGRIIGFKKTQRFGSFVAVQKLRESKWFKSDEYRIFCAVIESGFIVELRCGAAVAHKLAEEQERKQQCESLMCKQRQRQRQLQLQRQQQQQQRQEQQQEQQKLKEIKVSCSSTSSNIDDKSNDFNKPLNHINFEDRKSHNSDNCDDKQLNHNDETDHNHDNDVVDDDDEIALRNDNDKQIASWFGIVLCKMNKDNKTKPDTIEIYSVKIRDNGTFRLMKWSLQDVWTNNWELRICNFADKEKEPHNERDIRNQITFARKTRHSLWHNTKHFTYWCRYGSRQQDVRKRQISECIKWGSIGMNAGMILLMNKPKSYFAAK